MKILEYHYNQYIFLFEIVFSLYLFRNPSDVWSHLSVCFPVCSTGLDQHLCSKANMRCED